MSAKNTLKEPITTTKVDGMYHSLEWMISAFCYTLVFIVFEMQAYTIPTGSMADTLKGAHFRLRCEQCAYPYDYDYLPSEYGFQRNQVSGKDEEVRPGNPRCPSCGYYRRSGQRVPVIKGDRIFVLKCIYQFLDPRRWDVVVFKNPTQPTENYIKRMIAGPGETVEIIDGDVYINGKIARKPPNVQRELWMPVYVNDYQPKGIRDNNFNGHTWSQPFQNVESSQWNLVAEGSTVFVLDDPSGRHHRFVYNTNAGNDFRATYAYDDPRAYRYLPICSDLQVRFVGELKDGLSKVETELSKYGIRYLAWVDGTGQLGIVQENAEGNREFLVQDSISVSPKNAFNFSFAIVDHSVQLKVGGRQWTKEFRDTPDGMGPKHTLLPSVAIQGKGRIRLSHISLWRDIHYVSNSRASRASEGNPFTLGNEEYFVCGDNSPNSADARVWNTPGLGNGKEYRTGTVPRDYLVGKAFFVYWPGPYRPWNATRFADSLERTPLGRLAKIFLNVPHIDGIKLIYGGRESLTPYPSPETPRHDG